MRTKKVFYAAFTAMALAVAFTACKKDQTAQDEPKVAVTGITLSHTADTLTVGETLTLTPTVQPADATNKAVAWTSGNTAVATVSNGTVAALSAGTVAITVTTQDGSKKATCTVTVVTAHPLGTISFATTQTWTVGSQTWSDAVTATGCNKTTFKGNNLDCRSNPSYKGDLFSWYAVDAYKDKLCPDGWRVPTKQDFIALDIALGGTGNVTTNITLGNKYLNTWGGSYGGYCRSDGSLRSQGAGADYWSQSEYSAGIGFNLHLYSDGNVNPQSWSSKVYGFTLRCVR